MRGVACLGLVLLLGCGERSSGAPPAGAPASASASAALSAEPLSSREVARVDQSARPAQPTRAERPRETRDWLRDTRERSIDARYFAKGLRGPIQEKFVGLLICKIKVNGDTWDDTTFGLGSAGLPEIRVGGPSRTVIFGDDRASGFASFADVEVESTSSLRLVLDDLDAAVDDDITTLSLTAERGFPMEASDKHASASCAGIPPEVYAADLAKARAAGEAALEKAELPNPFDITKRDESEKPLLVARAALREWALFVGTYEPALRGALLRADRVRDDWRKQLHAAIDAELASSNRGVEWRELAGMKVRALREPGTLELSLLQSADYLWSDQTIGKVQLGFVNADGAVVRTTFATVTVDGVNVFPPNTTIPKGKLVNVKLSPGTMDARYVVLSVGGGKSLFFPYR